MDINERKNIVTNIEKYENDITHANIDIVVAVFFALLGIGAAIAASTIVPKESQAAPTIIFTGFCFLLGSTISIIYLNAKKAELRKKIKGQNNKLKINRLERNGNERVTGSVKTYKR